MALYPTRELCKKEEKSGSSLKNSDLFWTGSPVSSQVGNTRGLEVFGRIRCLLSMLHLSKLYS